MCHFTLQRLSEVLRSFAMSRLFDLPLFPLSMVIYPDQQAALHIFEPRYQEMVQDCLEHEMPFGLILYEDGKMAEVGCTAVIQEVVQDYGDGRLDIVVEGDERFRVDDLRQEKAYLTADVETVEDADGDAEDGVTQRVIRSEEHTSELQSRGHLVCRLLLEKKKHTPLGRHA